MAKVRISKGKFDGINACADERGVIAALAMDQRGSLQKMIAKASAVGATPTADDLTRFKAAVTHVLSPHASAILLDPEYGLPALKDKAASDRPAAGLREERLRHDDQGPPARSAPGVERAAAGRGRRRRHQAARPLQP